jgi:Dolichyl-phosphate-mannose-protein mannosyltransferase
VLSAWIAATGGVRFSFFGIAVRATDPYRPLIAAGVAYAIRMFIGGRDSLREDRRRIWAAVTPRTITAALILLIVGLGLVEGSGIAGGADSHGYISQADLWLKQNIVIAQPDARKVPWPEGQWTFSPLGYRPAPSRNDIVPVYAPGFPLLLALFKFVAGQCAIGSTVPIFAGVLLAVTFAIGRKSVSEEVGAAAAWIMATSPVFLYMLMSPMSDIPAAMFWGLAAYGCLAGSRTGAVLGGLAGAIAVLIRPNLVHVGLAMAVWMLVADVRVAGARRFVRPVLFVLPLGVASVAIAALNHYLYGAVTNSGYGSLGGVFNARFVWRNLINYGSWLAQSQTPLAVIGLLALLAPASRWMKSRAPIHGGGLLAVMSVSVIVTYLFYMNFDAWWYLRFLLPMWFALCVGSAYALTNASGKAFNRAGTAILLCVGGYGMWFARDAGVLDLGRNEQRYVRIAQLVRDTTEPNSVIITLQHSGSVRYYGERVTLRYEVLHDRWLDKSIAWLHANGFHPYILLDNPEHEAFKTKFGGRNVAGNLDMAIVFEYRDRYNTSTFLYDPLQPSKLTSVPVLVAAPQYDRVRNCAPPGRLQPIFAMENAKR